MGGKDENVFDIMQGVSINIFVKKKQSVILSEARKGEVEGSLARVYHYELFGKRFEKYAFLADTPFKDIEWNELNPQGPQYFFVPKSEIGKDEYERGFAVNELFGVNSTGVLTANDNLNVSFSIDEHRSKLLDLQTMQESDWRKKYNRPKDARDWTYNGAKIDSNRDGKIITYAYRPLDNRYTFYTGNSKGLYTNPRKEVMNHIIDYDNICMDICRFSATDIWTLVFISKFIIDDSFVSNKTKERGYVFPLYLYPTESEEKLGETRKPNLDEKIWSKIDKSAKLKTTPEQVFDYIYGVLHTPSYREKYKEFLKIDFPRIPYPEKKEEFERVVSIGNKLRKLHLMEEIPPQATSFDIEGDNAVSEIRFEKEKVYINKTQYFANVPELAWNFYIGGYQPAQKWLKDRKNRTLTYDDVSHYRKIIAILLETHNLMQELDKKA